MTIRIIDQIIALLCPKQTPPVKVNVHDVLAKKYAVHKAAGGQDLNYDTSVADLMILLGLDSSAKNRRALAVELGYNEPMLIDNRVMNEWLYDAIEQRLAENGGEWE